MTFLFVFLYPAFIIFLVFYNRRDKLLNLFIGYLFILTFSLPYWEKSLFNLIGLYPYYLAAIFLIIYYTFFYIKNDNIRVDSLDILVLLFCLLLEAGNLFSNSSKLTVLQIIFKEIYRIILIWGGFFLSRRIVVNKDQYRKVFLSISIFGVVMAIILFMEFLTGKSLFDLFKFSDQSDIILAAGGDRNILDIRSGLVRPQGVFISAVYTAFFFYLSFISTIFLLLIQKKKFYYFNLLIIITGILITQTRMTYIAILPIIIIYLFINKKFVIPLGLAFLIVTILSFIVFPDLGDFLNGLVNSLLHLNSVTSTVYLGNLYYRIDLNNYIFSILSTIPLFGFGSYYLNSVFTDVTNFYVGTIIYSGIISAIIFVILEIISLIKISKNKALGQMNSKLPFVALIAISICYVQFWSTSEPGNAYYLFWALLGVLLSKRVNESTLRSSFNQQS